MDMAIVLHDGLCWTYPTSICQSALQGYVHPHDTIRPLGERQDCRGESLRVFGQFSWLEAGSGKVALPHPA